MYFRRKAVSLILALTAVFGFACIPQQVKADEAYDVANEILDFSKDGSYTVDFTYGEIEKYVPVYLSKRGVLTLSYSISSGDVAYIEALDDIDAVETKQFKISVGGDYLDYNFFTFVDGNSEGNSETFAYLEDEKCLFYLDVVAFTEEYYNASTGDFDSMSESEQNRILDEVINKEKSVTISWEFDEIEVKKLNLKSTDITVSTTGKVSKFKLDPIIKPEYATDTDISWISKNTDVAEVSGRGVVRGVGTGTTKIIGRTKDGSGKKVVCKVHVVERNVSLSDDNISVGINESASLSATVIPAESYKWSVKDSKIATVDKKGNIKGKKAGTTTVYIETASGKRVSCSVSVFSRTANLSKSSVSVTAGASVKLGATVTPSEWYSWHSEDESIAIVDGNGNVTGVNPGSTSVYVVTASGVKSGKCAVKVERKADVKADDSVKMPKLSANNTAVYINNSVKVTLDSGTTGGQWICSSGLTIVSSSGSECQLKAKEKGTGTVTYTVGDKSAVVKIEVVDFFSK